MVSFKDRFMRKKPPDDESNSIGNSPKIEIEGIDTEVVVVFNKKRDLSATLMFVINIIAFSMALFHLYAAGPGNLLPNTLRAIHLAFGLCLVFLLYPMTQKIGKTKIPFYDMLLGLGGIVANLYIVFNLEALTIRAGLLTTTDLLMGIMMILVLIEAARRVVGPILTGIAIFFIFYTLFGPWFPGVIAHRGVPIEGLVRHMYLTLEGVFGVALGVSASFIFLFILMGTILTHMGTGEFLMKLALCGFGTQRGGPAKACVIASSLIGTINGSTIANICTTGTFTIPLMKKVGFKSHFAASVEATASLGGQIMPPVMGAAAFIIAENLGVPYLSVAVAALFPASLYFCGIFFATHQESVRQNIQGMKKEELPVFREVIKKGYLILPLFAIVFMLVRGYSPSFAGFTAVLLALGLSFLNRETWMTPRRLFIALSDGAKNAIEVLIACAVVGFIVGSFTLSGLGLQLASIVVGVGGGHLFPTLVLTAITGIILGMGLPTTANYVMMAMVTVPAVVMLGVEPMVAHMFCFYYGIISDVTPPVALAALCASGLAGANFWKTTFNSTKLACAAYVVPFFFVYNPQLVLGVLPFEWMHLSELVFTFLGVLILSCALYNFVVAKGKWYERLVLFVSAFLTILPDFWSSIIGIAIFVAVYLLQRRRNKKAASEEASAIEGETLNA